MVRGKGWLALGVVVVVVGLIALWLLRRSEATSVSKAERSATHEGPHGARRSEPPLDPQILHSGILVSGRIVSGTTPLRRTKLFAQVDQLLDLVVSDDNGQFSMLLAHGGQLHFEVIGADVLSPAALTLSRDLTGIEVIVGGWASIRGTVRRNGVPIAGATVHFGDEIPTAVTDRAGTYQSAELPAGTHRVSAESEELDVATAEKRVELQKRERRENVDLELDHGAVVSGTVLDESGAPVPGVAVWFRRGGPYESAVTTTDTEGRYIFQRLGVGEYLVVVLPAESDLTVYVNPKSDERSRIRLTRPDERVEQFDLVVAMAQTPLRGRVVDESGAGLAGATIDVGSLEEGARLDHAGKMRFPGRADGSFDTKPLPAGRYEVRASTPDGTAVARIKHPDEVAVVTIPAHGTMSGTLEGFAGTPVVALSLIRVPVHGNHFSVDRVPRGETTVTAVAGDEMAVQRVDVQPPAPTVVVLRPQPLARVNVTVSNAKVADRTWCRWAIAGLDRSFALDESGRFSVALPVGMKVWLSCNSPHTSGEAETPELTEAGADVRLETKRPEN